MEKRQEIELLRIVSVFGIVWYHTETIGKNIAYSGLIVFTIISMCFSAQSDLKFKPLLLKRAKRILTPWMFWLFFYGVINIFFKNQPFLKVDNGLISGLLAGTSIHLWYMPFIFMAVILFGLFKRYINGQKLAFLCGFFIIFSFTMTGYWRPWALSLNSPWGQYAHALNGVLIGIFFANCATMPKSLLAAFILFILIVVALFSLSFSGIGLPYLVGIITTALALLPRWNYHPGFKINELSECTLGIYLSHKFWLIVINKFGFSLDYSLPFLVFSVSAISVWCFKRVAPGLSKYAV